MTSAQARAASRCRAMLAMLGRLGVLSTAQFESASRSVVDSNIGYYDEVRGAPLVKMLADNYRVHCATFFGQLGFESLMPASMRTPEFDDGCFCVYPWSPAHPSLHGVLSRRCRTGMV